ncbi:hypothetical protein KAU45_04775 [bacterium]|nr:hypothetical protein [bacterium]
MNVLLPGLMPRTETLIRATRDHDRGRISRPELDEVARADVGDLRQLQEGFGYLSTGLFNWQDLLRPFAEIVPGAHVGGLKRFYETNTFWRVLEFPSDAVVNDSVSPEWVRKYFFADGLFTEDESSVFTLPFPFLFQSYSRGLPLGKITKIIGDVAGWLGQHKAKVLCFYEPGFGYLEPTGEEEKLAVKFTEDVKGRIEIPVYIVSSFFGLGSSADFFFSLPADGFGVDLYANSLDEVLRGFPAGKVLLAGVANTDSTLIESVEGLRKVLGRIGAELPLDRVYLTPSGPAELLPRDVLEAKVRNLREVLA